MSGTGSALLLGITLCCLGAWAKENIGEYHYVCPKFHSESCKVPNPRGCHGDQYCPKGQKCCCSDCGWKCVTAERVKPGRCPPIMPRCVGPPPKPSCQTDGDCSGRQKCCTLCGKVCQDPHEESEGACPVPSDPRKLQCPSVYCARNDDCLTPQKCCQSGGKQRCMHV
ncbi:hypothetical protein XENTR_v10015346 [Xenopus tropicalis]|uniref:Whey acidic protein n=1 Tax=Xenopus tropicalis TaxID=8364 RepID=A0A6I8QJ14_XENTR|nr:whey acidic protein [Xenopus tropicalis]KAE8605850.1 hypothetical protein XENTR_v10015346 [Xenopus tropicalis]|eukprot:XP_002944360.2 PREDICTED: whey acidic protein-like [Xenopus tropicalis]